MHLAAACLPPLHAARGRVVHSRPLSGDASRTVSLTHLSSLNKQTETAVAAAVDALNDRSARAYLRQEGLSSRCPSGSVTGPCLPALRRRVLADVYALTPPLAVPFGQPPQPGDAGALLPV